MSLRYELQHFKLKLRVVTLCERLGISAAMAEDSSAALWKTTVDDDMEDPKKLVHQEGETTHNADKMPMPKI